MWRIIGILIISLLISTSSFAATWFLRSTGNDANSGKDNVGISCNTGSFDYTTPTAPTITLTNAFSSYTPAAGDYLYLGNGSFTAVFPVVSKTNANTLVLGTAFSHTGTIGTGTITSGAQGAKVDLGGIGAVYGSGDTIMVSDNIPDNGSNYFGSNLAFGFTMQSTVPGVVRSIVNNNQNVPIFTDQGSSTVTGTVTASDIIFDMGADLYGTGPFDIRNVNDSLSFVFTNCTFKAYNAPIWYTVVEASIARSFTATNCTFGQTGASNGGFGLASFVNATFTNDTFTFPAAGELVIGNVTGQFLLKGSTITGLQAVASNATASGGFVNIDGNTITTTSDGDNITLGGYYDSIRIANNILTSAANIEPAITLGTESSNPNDYNAHPIRYLAVLNNHITMTGQAHATFVGLGTGSKGSAGSNLVSILGGGEFAYNIINAGTQNSAGWPFKTSGWDIHHNVFYSNNASGPANNGLALAGSSNCHVHQNTVYAASPMALFVEHNQALNLANNNIITDNIFISASTGTPIIISTDAQTYNNFVDRNVYWEVGGGFNLSTLQSSWQTGVDSENTIYANNDQNSIAVDPAVANAIVGDMRLLVNSPARGLKDSTLNLSKWNDKGAFQYAGGNNTNGWSGGGWGG